MHTSTKQPKGFSTTMKAVIVGLLVIVLSSAYFGIRTMGDTTVALTLFTNQALERGLVGHWTFDSSDLDLSSASSTALDRSGNANNADFYGAVDTVDGLTPTVTGTPQTYQENDSSMPVDLPSGIQSGELIVSIVAYASGTSGTDNCSMVGFTLLNESNVTSNVGGCAFYRIADGTEGSTATFSGDAFDEVAAITFRVADHDGEAPEISSATGSSGSANPPSHTPSGGSAEYLWIAAASVDAGRSITGFPTNYTEMNTEIYTSQVTATVATYTTTASSQDPGSFTHTSDQWVAWTISVAGTASVAGDAVTTKSAPGKLGQSINFDGTDDYLDIGNLGSGIQAVSFWVKTATSTTNAKLIDIDGTDQIETNGSSVITATSWPGTVTIYQDGVAGSTTLTEGWHHIVITTTSSVNGSDFDIGRIEGEGYFGGSIDDVRVYDRELTSRDAQRLYELGATTRQNKTIDTSARARDGLMAHWTFDGVDTDFSSTSAAYKDVSGGGYDGSFEGAPAGETGGSSPTAPATNLIGHWPLDESSGNAIDSGSGGNDGTVTGATQNVAGQIGTAYSFDGSGDEVNIGDTNDIGTGDFTFMGWFTQDTNDLGWVVAKTEGYEGYGALADSDQEFMCRLSHGPTSDDFQLYSPVESFTTDEWTHFACVIDRDGNMSIFLNGNFATSTSIVAADGENIDGSTVLRIGNRQQSTSFDYLSADIDDVRIYDRVLTTTEIHDTYKAGKDNASLINIRDSVRTAATADGSGDMVVNMPSNVENDDYLVVILGRDQDDAGDITLPAGWTSGDDLSGTSGNDMQAFIAYKLVTSAGSEPSTYTFDGTTSSEEFVAFALALSGVDTTTPEDEEMSGNLTYFQNDASPSLSSITTVTDNAFVLGFWYVDQDPDVTPPTSGGWKTLATDEMDTSALNNLNVVYTIQESFGATGAVELTAAGSGDETIGGQFAFRPAAVSVGSGSSGVIETSGVGALGQSINFDGTDDYLDIGNLGSGIQAVSFWVKTATSTTNAKLIDIDGTDQIETNGSSVITATSWPGTVTIYQDGVAGSTTLTEGWHHIVITTTSSVNGSDFDIGRIEGEGYFGGSIDDVRVYDRELTSRDAQRLYELGATTRVGVTINNNASLTNELLAHWSFDGKDMDYITSTTTEVQDRSGNNNDADLQPDDSVTTGGGAGAAVYVSSGGGTGTSFSYDIGSAGDRLVVVMPADENTGTNLSGVSVDSNACTMVQQATNTFSEGAHTELWYCDDDDLGSASGSVTVALTGADSGWATHVHVFTGVDQTGPSDSGKEDAGTNTSNIQIENIDTTTDGVLVMGASAATQSINFNSWTTPLVERLESPDPTAATFGSASGIPTTNGMNQTYTASLNQTTGTVSGVIAAWDPAAGGGGTTTYTSTTTRAAFGKIGQALDFDGVNEYVDVGNLGSGIQAVSFWVKTATSTTNAKLIDIDGTDQIETNGSSVITATSWPGTVTIYQDGVAGSTTLTEGWHHIVITTTSSVNGSDFDIGRIEGEGYFGGSIDDVRVYTRALTARDVNELYGLGN